MNIRDDARKEAKELAANAAQSASATPGGPPRKAKPQPKAKANAKAKSKPKDSSTKKAAGDKPPSFSVEWTREQVQCRTGKRGVGQNMALKFSEHGGMERAVKKAKQWVGDKKRELGFK